MRWPEKRKGPAQGRAIPDQAKGEPIGGKIIFPPLQSSLSNYLIFPISAAMNSTANISSSSPGGKTLIERLQLYIFHRVLNIS